MNISVFNSEHYEAVWAVPMSGFGHIADEQPLPYIHISGRECSPRFGGEFVSITNLPLPYGTLRLGWPWKQRFFNLFRKRVNIYWREIFNTFTREDKLFALYEQCEFKATSNGFAGKSPVIYFKRTFSFGKEFIDVKDIITFKERIDFEFFVYSNFCFNKGSEIVITASENSNFKNEFETSTGKAITKGKKLENVSFKPGETLQCRLRYHLPQ
ncbi:hypothetical protein [Vibrio parahaemolyticus]|uniref:hypothetical protein n=1 Tax=Vibrio parahaemolyticus TaxID=670 RepID=UPI001037D659|nr:hypothetical protein [Vibrio parahaemolyticus]EJG0778697.1 hypothetical protein [Vibrio parahaemolyticus]ELB2107532.1 hypothetical protein [Vibrio parahaemolyticus]MDA0388957.1 hypothetical protein [Vibrio parahaemolyticus]MDA0392871.1 hypothetical protein [Vibrio parahaemolyticus]MDA0398059.1 hypothetical protein [Vibrio parahaemolyticus]